MSVSTSAATAAIKRSKWKFTTASAFTLARANHAKTDKRQDTGVAALAAASAESITRRLTQCLYNSERAGGDNFKNFGGRLRRVARSFEISSRQSAERGRAAK